MNLAFVGYNELCRCRKGHTCIIHLDLHNSSYPTQPHSLICHFLTRIRHSILDRLIQYLFIKTRVLHKKMKIHIEVIYLESVVLIFLHFEKQKHVFLNLEE